MEHSFHWGGDPEDLYVEASGPATLAGFSAMTDDLDADARLRPNMKILVDHRRLDWTAMSAEDARQRARDRMALSDPIGQSRIAVVVSEPSAYGIERMMEGLADQMVEDSIVKPYAFTTRIFYSIDEAREWLAAQTG